MSAGDVCRARPGQGRADRAGRGRAALRGCRRRLPDDAPADGRGDARRRAAAPRARHLAEADEVPGGAGDLLLHDGGLCPLAAEGTLGRRWHRLYVASVVSAMGAEIVWISGAAALDTSSHFNPTPIGMALYAAAGVLAVWFTSSTLVYGLLIARNRRPGFDPALRTGLALGLIPTFVLSVAFAGYMATRQPLGWGGRRTTWAGSGDGLVAGGGRSPRGAFLRDARDARGAARGVRRRADAAAATGGPGDLGVRARVGLLCAAFAQALAGQPFLAALPSDRIWPAAQGLFEVGPPATRWQCHGPG